ncbi:MAG: hypothetical protein LAT56_03905 [Wenzhouxiangella sp.]|nr:hypothetical protein [Wenzhouxiangella sp.]
MSSGSRNNAASELASLRLAQPALGPMISRGQFDRIAEHVREVAVAAELLAVTDMARLEHVLSDEAMCKYFAIALNGLLHGKRSLEERFGHWLGVLAAQSMASWPMATIWPFLLHPQRYFPVFPDQLKIHADSAGLDLSAQPTWPAYVASQRLAHQLKKYRNLDSFIDLHRALSS